MEQLKQIQDLIEVQYPIAFSFSTLNEDLSKQLLIWHLEEQRKMLIGMQDEYSDNHYGVVESKRIELSEQIETLKQSKL
jgi:hypothetical protein